MISATATLLLLQLFSHVNAQTTPTLPTVTAAPGTLGLGAVCSSKEQCANGADCYGVTAFTIRTCGSFQSSCTSDNQCATNTCVSGFCSGFLATESYRITSTASTSARTSGSATATGSAVRPNLPTITAEAHTLKLGETCSSTEQCPIGVQCFGSTAFTIPQCGKFNAACTSDSQCATNTCNNGLCNGFIASSLTTETRTSVAVGTGGSTGTLTAAPTPTSSQLQVTGAAVALRRSATGILVVAAGVAWAL